MNQKEIKALSKTHIFETREVASSYVYGGAEIVSDQFLTKLQEALAGLDKATVRVGGLDCDYCSGGGHLQVQGWREKTENDYVRERELEEYRKADAANLIKRREEYDRQEFIRLSKKFSGETMKAGD